MFPICISLIICDLEHLLYAFCPYVYILGINVYSVLYAIIIQVASDVVLYQYFINSGYLPFYTQVLCKNWFPSVVSVFTPLILSFNVNKFYVCYNLTGLFLISLPPTWMSYLTKSLSNQMSHSFFFIFFSRSFIFVFTFN